MHILTVILDGPLNVPFYIGPWGAAAVTASIIVLAILSYKRGTWKSTADAAVVEMNVYKEACERLREERKHVDEAKAELIAQVNKLQAATDLKPLVEIVSNWVLEGRTRFGTAERRLDEIHAENTKALVCVLEEVKAQRLTTEDAFRQLTNAFQQHTLEDHQVNIENKEIHYRFVAMMDSVERRLTEVAVKVGHVKWEELAIKETVIEQRQVRP